jgi:HEPN domain-containing protein
MSEPANAWVAFAREDMRMAELAYDDGIWNQTCFHVQQCVEKMLKAALARQGVPIPQIHRLSDLLDRVDPVTSQALAHLGPRIRALDRFYTPARYPDALPGTLPEGLPDQPKAAAARNLATEVMAILDR